MIQPISNRHSALADSKIDYSVVSHNEVTDEWHVELSLAAIRALARKSGELKEIKNSHKELTRQAALVPDLEKDRAQLATLREATATAESVMRKAVRRINAMEKLLGIEPGAKLPDSAALIAQPNAEQSKPAAKPKRSGSDVWERTG